MSLPRIRFERLYPTQDPRNPGLSPSVTKVYIGGQQQEGAQQAKYFRADTPLDIAHADPLTLLRQAAAELLHTCNERRHIMVHGRLHDQYRGALAVFPVKLTHFAEQPQHGLWLDMDSSVAPDGMDPTSIEAIHWLITNELPEAFHDKSCIVHFSASAGFKGQKIKAHLLYLISEAFDIALAKAWAMGHNAERMLITGVVKTLDYAPWNSIVQKMYVAAPIIIDGPDPFAGRDRVQLIPGNTHTVDIAELHRISLAEVAADIGSTVMPSKTRSARARTPAVVGAGASTSEWGGIYDCWVDGDFAATLNNCANRFMQGDTHTTIHGTAILWHRDGRRTSVEHIADTLFAGFDAARQAGKVDHTDEYFATEMRRFVASADGADKKGLHLQRVATPHSKLATMARKGTQMAQDELWSLYLGLVDRHPLETLQELLKRLPENLDPGTLAKITRHHEREHKRPPLRRLSGARLPGTLDAVVDQMDLKPGTLQAVRGPTGIGKTELLGKALTKRAKRVVYISGRISLVADAASRLGLVDYQTSRYNEGGPPTGLATCLPSLTRRDVEWAMYEADLIIIDEVNAVLDLLTSHKIMGRKYDRTVEILQTAFKRAAVVVMDAYLGNEELRLLHALGAGSQGTTAWDIKGRPFAGVPVTQVHRAQAEKAIGQALAMNGRVLLCTDAKGGIRTLRTKHPQWFTEHKSLVITADSKKDSEQQRFMSQPDAVFAEHELVVLSPAVDTGVSITTPADLVVLITRGTLDCEQLAQFIHRARRPERILLVIEGSAPRANLHGLAYLHALGQLHNVGHDEGYSQVPDIDPDGNLIATNPTGHSLGRDRYNAQRIADQFFRPRAGRLPALLIHLGAQFQLDIQTPDKDWSKEHTAASKQARMDYMQSIVQAQVLLPHQREALADRAKGEADVLAMLRFDMVETLALPDPAQLSLQHVDWYLRYPGAARVAEQTFSDKHQKDEQQHRPQLSMRGATAQRAALVRLVLATLNPVNDTAYKPDIERARDAIGEYASDHGGALLVHFDETGTAPGNVRRALKLAGIALQHNRKRQNWTIDASAAVAVAARRSGNTAALLTAQARGAMRLAGAPKSVCNTANITVSTTSTGGMTITFPDLAGQPLRDLRRRIKTGAIKGNTWHLPPAADTPHPVDNDE